MIFKFTGGENMAKQQMMKSLMAKENRVRIITAAGVLGMVLILLSSFTEGEKPAEKATNPTTNDEYVVSLEHKLKTLVTSIDGVGKANVMVTIESGVEYIYAKEEKKNSDTTKDYAGDDELTVQQKDNTEHKYILVDGGGGKKQALLETQLEPKIKGVVVVCEGADNPMVESRVINAVTTALDIQSNQICVTKLNNQNKK